MARRPIPVSLLFLVFLATPAPVAQAAKHHGARPRATKSIIEDLEEQWRQAQLRDDASAMDRLLSDDFVGITASGQMVTKAQQLDRIRDHQFALTRLNLSDTKIKVIAGKIAVVTCTAEIEGKNEDGAIQGTFRYTRVYQRLPGGAWKITSFEATRVPQSRRRTADEAPAGGLSR